MRSAFAFILHGFSLPFGAVGGQRLVFDGDDASIKVYDSTGFLVGNIDEVGGSMFIQALSQGGARAYLTSTTGAAFLVLDPPDWGGHTISAGDIVGDVDTGTGRPFILLRSPRVDGGEMVRAYFIGEDAIAHDIPKISFDGGNLLPCDFIVNRRSVPLGILPNGQFKVNTDDVARAADVNTDMSVTVDVSSTRVYKVSLTSGVAWGTAGAQYFIDLHDGTSIVGRFYLAPANTTVAFSTDAHIAATVDYFPGTTGTKTLTVRNGAGSGGTALMKRGLNFSYRSLTISDGGRLTNAI